MNLDGRPKLLNGLNALDTINVYQFSITVVPFTIIVIV